MKEQTTYTKKLEILLKQAKESSDQRVFTQLFTPMIQKGLDDTSPKTLPLSNTVFSVKDLIDVSGYTTKAGTTFLANEPPAQKNAEVVDRLLDAGATIVGHTNMTELAYSGLGLNPHYGNVENPIATDCIVGGSTSGGAASVASNLVDVAIGSDTGGSLRIPAAFTGLVGYKPTQNTVSRKGCLPLSSYLDSIGPIAKDVASCEKVWRIISGQEKQIVGESDLVVSDNFGFDELDKPVSEGFQSALHRISSFATVKKEKFDFLELYKKLPVWQMSAVESRAYYAKWYEGYKSQFDPNVYLRMRRADEVSGIAYQQTIYHREQLIEQVKETLSKQILLLPTVAILPPKIADCLDPDEFTRLNLLALRNTSFANVIDGCSITIPYEYQGSVIGVMLVAANGQDERLLQMASEVEKRLS